MNTRRRLEQLEDLKKMTESDYKRDDIQARKIIRGGILVMIFGFVGIYFSYFLFSTLGYGG